MKMMILLTLIAACLVTNMRLTSSAIVLNREKLIQMNTAYNTTTSLDLCCSLLNSIESNTFSNSSQLVNLRLEKNKLTIILSGVFSDLKKLQVLELWSNSLQNLDATMFAGLNNLRKLFLNENKLVSIAADTFKSMPNLKILDLSYNKLTAIDSSIFTGLANMQAIYLNNNYLPQTAEVNSLCKTTTNPICKLYIV